MSNGQGQGGRKSGDDRTLLDPLSSDELDALRKARQRMQAKKGGAAAHQIVIGSDSGESGDAPTRSMPALPSFEGNVSLDQIGTSDSSSSSPPAEEQPTLLGTPAQVAVPGPESQAIPGAPPSGPVAQPSPTGGPPQPGQPGFGENTLLWMQAPKVAPPGATVGGAPSSGVLPAVSRKEAAKIRLKTIGAVVVFGGIGLAILLTAILPQERGALELHTQPPGAQVSINGRISPQMTPVKLTLQTGEHDIEITLDGHEAYSFKANIEEGNAPARKEIDLTPISEPGKMTVGIKVEPVAAQITIDNVVHPQKSSLKIANVDPGKPHKITVEAGGYVPVTQEIPPGKLKAEYTFDLKKDATTPQ